MPGRWRGGGTAGLRRQLTQDEQGTGPLSEFGEGNGALESAFLRLTASSA